MRHPSYGVGDIRRGIVHRVDVPAELRAARRRAGLTQRALAERARTSQAAIAAYEAGRKDPTAGTLVRLLAATGSRLVVTGSRDDDLAAVGRTLVDVLHLAAALPVRHQQYLHFPRVPALPFA